jgi:hypothetical protein
VTEPKSAICSTSPSGTKDFEKLRHAETEKLRGGRRDFEAWDVDFSVVKSAGEMEWLQGLPSFACLSGGVRR